MIFWFALGISISITSLSARASGDSRSIAQDPNWLEPIEISGDTRPLANRLLSPVSREQFFGVREQVQSFVGQTPGFFLQEACGNCGAQRAVLVGLRAEHTTVFTEGLPLRPSVGSLYGFDLIPLIAIDQIEVGRSAVDAAERPQSIGGFVDQRLRSSLQAKAELQLGGGFWPWPSTGNQVGMLSSGVIHEIDSKTKRLSLLVSADRFERQSWDEDRNGVAESPYRSDLRGTVVLGLDGPGLDSSLRFSAGESLIVGGPHRHPADRPSGVPPRSARGIDFKDRRVDRDFFGDPAMILDWIQLKGFEVQSKSVLELSPSDGADRALVVNLGFSENTQDAIYQHGFDYLYKDRIFSGETKHVSALLGGALTLGASHQREGFQAQSQSGFIFADRDQFVLSQSGIFGNWSGELRKGLELTASGRAEFISLHYPATGRGFDSTVFVPRALLSHRLTDHTEVRVGWGRGSRAPTSFFESQHGVFETGYTVDVTGPEISDTLTAALSYNDPIKYITFEMTDLTMRGMAHAFDPTEELGQLSPLSYRNSNELDRLQNFSLLGGHKFFGNVLFLEAGIEFWNLKKSLKQKLLTAALDSRLFLQAQYKPKESVSLVARAVYIESRDLSPYSTYQNHFVDRSDHSLPEQQGTIQKRLQVPGFMTLDLIASLELTHQSSILVTALNVLNVTQVSLGENNSTWHWHFDHAHFDGLHIWGPSRGREVLVQYRYLF